MSANLIKGLAGLALLFAVSCSSKKKVQETAVQPDAAIQSQAMTFDPEGSDSGNISGLRSINFGYDQANLSAEAKSALDNNANWLNGNPKVTLQIEGHCDSRGSVEYNLALGERRAKAVKTYLVGMGIDANRLSIISYGKEKPLVMGDTEEAFYRNRRANFLPIAQ